MLLYVVFYTLRGIFEFKSCNLPIFQKTGLEPATSFQSPPDTYNLIQSYFYWEKESAEIADGENLFSYSDNKHISFYQISLVVIRIGCGNLTEWHVDRCRSRKGTAFFIKSHSIVDD